MGVKYPKRQSIKTIISSIWTNLSKFYFMILGFLLDYLDFWFGSLSIEDLFIKTTKEDCRAKKQKCIIWPLLLKCCLSPLSVKIICPRTAMHFTAVAKYSLTFSHYNPTIPSQPPGTLTQKVWVIMQTVTPTLTKCSPLTGLTFSWMHLPRSKEGSYFSKLLFLWYFSVLSCPFSEPVIRGYFSVFWVNFSYLKCLKYLLSLD